MWALLILGTATLFSGITLQNKPPVNIPSAGRVKTAKADDSAYRFFIRIQKTDDGTEYVVEETGNKATVEELRSIIKETAKSHPNLAVVICGDSEVKFADTQKIMKMCAEEGVYNMIFAAKEEPTNASPPPRIKVLYTFDEYNGAPDALCMHIAIGQDDKNNICYFTEVSGSPISAEEFKSLMEDQLYFHPELVFVVHCDEKIKSQHAPEFMNICTEVGAKKIVFSEWPVLPQKPIENSKIRLRVPNHALPNN